MYFARSISPWTAAFNEWLGRLRWYESLHVKIRRSGNYVNHVGLPLRIKFVLESSQPSPVRHVTSPKRSTRFVFCRSTLGMDNSWVVSTSFPRTNALPPPLSTHPSSVFKKRSCWRLTGLEGLLEAPELYSIKLDHDQKCLPNPFSVSVTLKYIAQSNLPPPGITTFSSRLRISTAFSVTSSFLPKLSSTHQTSYTLLKAATPSKSSCIWRKGSQMCYLTDFVIPLNLPPHPKIKEHWSYSQVSNAVQYPVHTRLN